jgi:hypothetical protein
MMATMHQRNCALAVSLIGAVLALAGCAYRLPPVTPASQELIHIVANAPEQYAVEVNTGTVREYDVPNDGRIKIGIPPYRLNCGVYLFDAIKVGGYGDPLNNWIVSITRNGKTIHKQSLRVTRKSPTDEAGYHIVKIRSRLVVKLRPVRETIILTINAPTSK